MVKQRNGPFVHVFPNNKTCQKKAHAAGFTGGYLGSQSEVDKVENPARWRCLFDL